MKSELDSIFARRRSGLILAIVGRSALVACVVLLAGSSIAVASSFFATDEETSRMSSAQRQANESLVREVLARIEPGQEVVQIDDMLFRVSDLVATNNFTGNQWTDGKVYFTFDAGLTDFQKGQWALATAMWEAAADLEFIERTTEPNYILLKTSTGNNSFVGMIGGEQIINMFNWSFETIIAHEIGHALGLKHEHQRPDRDSFVNILTSNITPGREGNFTIAAGGVTYTAYDFASAMHYGRTAFAISGCGCNTIEPLPAYSQWLNEIGKRERLSALDKAGMAARYGDPIPITLPNPDTFASTDVPKAITDTNTILSTLVVPSSKTISDITDINVFVDISHTFDGDLNVFLESPTGTVVELFTGVGGSGEDFFNTLVDDEASIPFSSGSPPYIYSFVPYSSLTTRIGSYQPEGTLSSFDTESAIGTWTLSVTDTASGDEGILNSWSLNVAGPDSEPSVSSISRTDADPTAAATVDFTVVFSESVSGVDTGDFTLTTTGAVAGASVTGVTGSGASYTVTVDTGGGDGTLRLDVSDDDTIVSTNTSVALGGFGAGNGDFTAGEAYTIDKTAPSIGIGAPSAGSVTSGSGPVSYTVTYTGADSVNLNTGNVSLLTTGTASGTVAVVNGTTSTPTVVISDAIGVGTIGIAISTGTASDLAGNTAAGAGPSTTFDVVAESISSTDVPKAIPDLSTITSTIDVPASKTISNIADLNVNIDITHTNVEDLDVFLESPTGTVVELFTDVGGTGNDFTSTKLDDEAGTSITAGSAPFTGSFVPEESLSDFDGETAIGTWTLTITDDAAPGTGTLNSWGLEISSGTPALPVGDRWVLFVALLAIVAGAVFYLKPRDGAMPNR